MPPEVVFSCFELEKKVSPATVKRKSDGKESCFCEKKIEVSEENKSVVRLLVRRVSELKVNEFFSVMVSVTVSVWGEGSRAPKLAHGRIQKSVYKNTVIRNLETNSKNCCDWV